MCLSLMFASLTSETSMPMILSDQMLLNLDAGLNMVAYIAILKMSFCLLFIVILNNYICSYMACMLVLL